MPKEIAVASVLLCSLVTAASVAFGQSAQVSPAQYAMSLAQDGVPAGIVASREVLAQVRRMPRPQATVGTPSVVRGTLASGLDLFNAAKGAFRASQDDGIVHLRSLEEPAEISSALDRSTQLDEAVEVPAMHAIYRYVVRAMRGVEPSQGYVWTGGLPGPECPINRPIRIAGGPATAIGLLDQVVRQVPGLLWVVSYNPDQPSVALKVGLMCQDGSFFRTDVY